MEYPVSAYYDSDYPITDYWDKRHAAWAEHPVTNTFAEKDAWFERRLAHILPNHIIGDWVLDFGCGCGMYSVPLLRRFDHYKGVDSSHSALQIARTFFPEFNSDGRSREYALSLPSKIDSPAESLDCVLTITVLQHQPNEFRIAYAKEIMRVLKAGGVYVGLEWIGDTKAYDMPPMPTQEWIELWGKIKQDVSTEHPEWEADHVWVWRK